MQEFQAPYLNSTSQLLPCQEIISRKQFWPKSNHSQRKDISLSLSLLNSGSGIFNKKKPTHLPLEKFKYYFCHLYLRIGFLPQLYELHHWQRLVTVINKDSSRKGRKYSLEY